MSEIKPNSIGIQFHPLSRSESYANANTISSFIVQMMNQVVLHLEALISREISWMTLTQRLNDIV